MLGEDSDQMRERQRRIMKRGGEKEGLEERNKKRKKRGRRGERGRRG